ncbi:hypothetical protein SVIO_079850 [Streptomyces violaceusniger]|uniref:Secreted protein n=1 Tax=Streptomyces violaceusniger TaxID=68280 RepID=A0A4D4L843_STRVO|nr:hypothetical protein SVIO_079850 [Streptomyces violaceusniger]
MPDSRLRRARARAAAAIGASALLGTVAIAAGPVGSAQAAPRTAAAADCSAPYRIEQKLDGGTTWRMCWHYESKAGLVLDDVSYQPKGESAPIKVLTSAKLGQIHVPYDDGSNEYDDLTGQDFAQGLQQLDPAECPGGTIKTVRVPDAWDPDHPNVKGLCATTRARGHAYRMGEGGFGARRARSTSSRARTCCSTP